MKNNSAQTTGQSLIPGSWWWILAILMIVAFGLCSLVGYYTLANVLIAGMAAYLLSQASRRKKRLEANRELIMKMNAKNRKQFIALDEREKANILTLSRLSNWIIPACLFFDGYTFVYNLLNHKETGFFGGMDQNMNILLFVMGLILGILFCFSCKARLKELLINLPQKS